MKITIILEEDKNAWIAEIEDSEGNSVAYGNTPQEALDKALATHMEYLTDELRELKKLTEPMVIMGPPPPLKGEKP